MGEPVREVEENGIQQQAVETRPPSRRSHQFRALSRRTGTYHRRQWKLDLCCLGLCPAYSSPKYLSYNRISVIIAGILGFVARHFADLTTNTANTTTLLSQGSFLLFSILNCRCALMFQHRNRNKSLFLP